MGTLKDKLDADYEIEMRRHDEEHPDCAGCLMPAFRESMDTGYAEACAEIHGMELDANDFVRPRDLHIVLAGAVGSLAALIDHVPFEGKMMVYEGLRQFGSDTRDHMMVAGAMQLLGDAGSADADQAAKGDGEAALRIARAVAEKTRAGGNIAQAEAMDAAIAATELIVAINRGQVEQADDAEEETRAAAPDA